eukprot:GEMP01057454.1.p1 GENE.GEMP01057454.1~~GEMP01057454.1.p1  ORF type:complete len:202 (+),score=65.45 GEMP01057454.1:139-744(+)
MVQTHFSMEFDQSSSFDDYQWSLDGGDDPFFAGMSDDDDMFLNPFSPSMTSGKPLDMKALNEEAAALRVERAIEAIDARDLPRRLIFEAELHLHSHRYRDALLCTLGFQQYLEDGCVLGQLVKENENNLRMQAQAIETICAYQLDDKDRAMALLETIQPTDDFSDFLHQRIVGTRDILMLMPMLLQAIEQEKKEPQQLTPS